MIFDKEIETVQKHEYQDIYRIGYAIILKVNKFIYPEHTRANFIYRELEDKTLFSKVKGLKDCVICKKDFEIPANYWDSAFTVRKDTIYFQHRLIEPTSDVSKYWIELKIGSGTVEGSFSAIAEFQSRITKVMDSYMGGVKI